ncbi:hypothetical protein NMG60_11022101 [Bertholletia excelsa]
MGNCFGTLKKSAAGIAPSDYIKGLPVVRLHGPTTGIVTSYIRFALLHKPVSVQFIPTETNCETPVLRCGSDTISGSRETLLQYVETKFPEPPLVRRCGWLEEATPLVVTATMLQHRSMMWHLERLVRWAEDLATRGGRARGDPAMGSPRMEVKKFGRSYSQLLELMLEHAQMEERIVFPILEKADRGLSRAANEEHARDLPIMNGIKEDIKSIGVLDSGSLAHHEALCNLSKRLKTLKDHCKEHFEEEEKGLLPLLEGAELSREQQEKVLEQCWDSMQGTHSHLFHFFIDGLIPQDAMHYLDLIIPSSNEDRVASMLRMIVQ